MQPVLPEPLVGAVLLGSTVPVFPVLPVLPEFPVMPVFPVLPVFPVGPEGAVVSLGLGEGLDVAVPDGAETDDTCDE